MSGIDPRPSMQRRPEDAGSVLGPLAVLASLGIALLALLALLAGCAASSGARGGTAPPAAEAGAVLSLSERPSHEGLYRAAVVEREETARAAGARAWVVRLTRADGTPVEDAVVRASLWSPDTGERPAAQPRASAHLGDGRYRVERLRFPGPGWWNVPLRVASPAGVDSLAFNLVLP